jgi:uncharacterized Tic20 family protein
MTEQSPPPSGPDPVPYATSAGKEYMGPPPDKDAIQMGMLCHLLGIFTGFLGPLIIWLMKKESSPFVDDQGKEALNFQIATLIVCLACIPLNLLFCIGSILVLIVQIARIIFGIIASMKANEGIAYRYPVTFRLIK